MNKSRMTSRFFLFKVLATLALMNAVSVYASEQIVGWIEDTSRTSVRITRNGKALSSDVRELHACDTVELINPNSTALLTLARQYRRIQLDSKVANRRLEIDCAEHSSLSEKALAVFRTFTAKSSHASTVKDSKVSALTRQGSTLQIPALGNYDPKLVAGDRHLTLGWEGGTPPFKVTLLRRGVNLPIFQFNNITTNEVRLPTYKFYPGVYELEVLDTEGNGQSEKALTVVEAALLPKMPAALVGASISENERQLLFAYYLEGLGNGEWSFEAMQRASWLYDSMPDAKTWLESRFAVKH